MTREELYQQQKQSLIDREGKLAEGIEAILDAEKTEGILPESAVKTLETLRESLYEKESWEISFSAGILNWCDAVALFSKLPINSAVFPSRYSFT